VVVFLHAWALAHPGYYRAWIDHIVRRGSIVIYPKYQSSILTPTWDFTPNALTAVQNALNELTGNSHVAPDLDRFAVVGHSAGGITGANLAVLSTSGRIPRPRALMVVEPGGRVAGINWIPMEDYSKISPDTLMLVMTGEHDLVVGEKTALRVFRGASRVRDKNFVVLKSDFHGWPFLWADHFAPLANRWLRPDAHDYHGFWKLFDALCDAAFRGQNREYAFGNTPEQRSLGRWSDGTPVQELEVWAWKRGRLRLLNSNGNGHK
jgi:pimeloyl-ACP methyl ester carboxylesterase